MQIPHDQVAKINKPLIRQYALMGWRNGVLGSIPSGSGYKRENDKRPLTWQPDGIHI